MEKTANFNCNRNHKCAINAPVREPSVTIFEDARSGSKQRSTRSSGRVSTKRAIIDRRAHHRSNPASECPVDLGVPYSQRPLGNVVEIENIQTCIKKTKNLRVP